MKFCCLPDIVIGVLRICFCLYSLALLSLSGELWWLQTFSISQDTALLRIPRTLETLFIPSSTSEGENWRGTLIYSLWTPVQIFTAEINTFSLFPSIVITQHILKSQLHIFGSEYNRSDQTAIGDSGYIHVYLQSLFCTHAMWSRSTESLRDVMVSFLPWDAVWTVGPYINLRLSGQFNFPQLDSEANRMHLTTRQSTTANSLKTFFVNKYQFFISNEKHVFYFTPGWVIVGMPQVCIIYFSASSSSQVTYTTCDHIISCTVKLNHVSHSADSNGKQNVMCMLFKTVSFLIDDLISVWVWRRHGVSYISVWH